MYIERIDIDKKLNVKYDDFRAVHIIGTMERLLDYLNSSCPNMIHTKPWNIIKTTHGWLVLFTK